MTNATKLLENFKIAYGGTYYQELTLLEIAYQLEYIQTIVDEEMFDDLCSSIYHAYMDDAEGFSLDEMINNLLCLDDCYLEDAIYEVIDGNYDALFGRF